MGSTFNIEFVKRYCQQRGLYWDEAMGKIAVAEAERVKLTQAQFDAAMVLHIDAVVRMWTPKSFPWRMRIGAALYWLGLMPQRVK
jgi:hypothetical protein